jgi:hypothetical protein
MSVKKMLIQLVARVAFLLLVTLVPQNRAPEATPIDSSLIGLLPESTVLAVELRDVDSRWSEIRGMRAISRFQDRLLAGSALGADDLRRLIGDHAVLALVVAADGRSALPVAVLRPRRISEAAALLEEASVSRGQQDPAYTVHRRGDTLWIGPIDAADRLATLARGTGTSLLKSLPLSETNARLPDGGLIRGWLNPRVLGDLLRDQIEGTRPEWLELVGALAAAELDAVRFAGFRRDLTPDGVITDAVIGYDTDVLPPEVTRALAFPAGRSVLPGAMPAGVVMMFSFPLEPKAGLAWLRYAAERDPRGPLRNLDFWIAELEARTRLDLELDLLDLLGERGWFFVLEGDTRETVRVVVILESRDPARVHRTLVRLEDWVKEHVAGRSLGLTVPRSREVPVLGRTARAMTFRSPLGEEPGPAFLATDEHIVLASGEQALKEGLRLLATRDAWRAAPHHPAFAGPADESLLVRGSALSPVVQALIENKTPAGVDGLAAALSGLVGDLESASLGVRYEGDVVRLWSRVGFTGGVDESNKPRSPS